MGVLQKLQERFFFFNIYIYIYIYIFFFLLNCFGFGGFGFVILSDFHRLFIKVLVFLQLGSLLLIYIAQFC